MDPGSDVSCYLDDLHVTFATLQARSEPDQLEAPGTDDGSRQVPRSLQVRVEVRHGSSAEMCASQGSPYVRSVMWRHVG